MELVKKLNNIKIRAAVQLAANQQPGEEFLRSSAELLPTIGAEVNALPLKMMDSSVQIPQVVACDKQGRIQTAREKQ